jgi:O-antigen/teichoic acid export membrane protein
MLKKLSTMAIFSFVGTLATFVFQTILTHLLSPGDYGLLAKWLTDIAYLGMFFVLGLDSAILYHAKLGQNYEENMGKNFTIYMLVFILGLIGIYMFSLDQYYYITLSVSIISFSIVSVFMTYFQFEENFKVYNYLTIVKPLIILFGFCFVFLFGYVLTTNQALVLYSILSLLVLGIVAIKYFTISSIRFEKRIFNDLGYYLFGIKSILNKFLSLTLYASTVYCLSYFSEYKNVAYFFVASSISKMVWVLPDSAGNILYPRFLKVDSEHQNESVIKEMFYYAQIVFLCNLLATITFFILGEFFINTLYEKSYITIFIPVIILLIGNQGMVYFKLISRYLASKNNWYPMYISLTIGVVVNLLGNYLLIPKYGLIGAALATSGSFLCCGIYISFYVKNSLFQFVNVLNLVKKII